MGCCIVGWLMMGGLQVLPAGTSTSVTSAGTSRPINHQPSTDTTTGGEVACMHGWILAGKLHRRKTVECTLTAGIAVTASNLRAQRGCADSCTMGGGSGSAGNSAASSSTSECWSERSGAAQMVRFSRGRPLPGLAHPPRRHDNGREILPHLPHRMVHPPTHPAEMTMTGRSSA